MKTLPLSQVNLTPAAFDAKPKGSTVTTGFSDILKQSLESVSEAKNVASEMQEGLVTGQHSIIHATMIAKETPTVSFRLLPKVQQKPLTAYQEIMRMQV
ncbi:MAG: flagellar hook-basal body complex protein FliE [Spirochaetales bacterium]|jgi:flagellar hook-basal body complex protein FliE|nr:flagellar hook-basal body complex protein FliE [Spirochaetales bacterium]